jgi:Fur family peroxide stress response transcriptional regulator
MIMKDKTVDKSNRKSSRQQSIVAVAVAGRQDHPTAEMVHATARKIDPHISLATVYRNLERRVEDGKLDKVTMSDGADRYDPNLSEHIHAVCSCCGRVFDVATNLSSQAQAYVAGEIAFRPRDCEITVYGFCKKCKRRKRKEVLC